MKRIGIDIETAANPERVAELPPPDPALGNLKDPVKIQEKLDAARASQLRRMALDPHFGRIVCVTVGLEEECQERWLRTHLLTALGDVEERALLQWLFDQIAIPGVLQHVTFNGEAFDLPFIMRRALLLRVSARNLIFPSSYLPRPDDHHLDVFRLLERTDVGNGRSGGSSGVAARTLSFYARTLLGWEEPPWGDVDKTDLAALIGTPDAQRIALGNQWDVRATLALAQLVTRYY